MFADTHVHPLMKYVHNDRNNLWRSFAGPIHIIGFLNNLVGIPAFSQSDFKRLAQGNFQVIFCALHPPEQQILFTKANDFWDDVVDGAAAQVISIPQKKLQEYRQPTYDHFKQLDVEYKTLFLGQSTSRRFKVNGKRRTCSFQIVKNFNEVKAIIDFNASQEAEFKIAVVLTIEGMHSLGRGHVSFNNAPNPHNVDDAGFMLRLDRIKGLTNADGHGWPTSPVVMNVTHAFDDTICGQAQALAKIMRDKLFKYAEEYSDPPKGGLNMPLSTLGKKVIKRMLNIDSNPAGRRIIPDIKHMSTATRRDYYEIIDAHNAQHSNDIIPLIMSHAAVNGKPHLNESNYNPKDSEKEYNNSSTFNPWSINLYDEEIIRIHETRGLIGIIMDQRILAGGKKVDLLRKYINNNHDHGNPYEYMTDREAWFSFIFDQIEYIVKTIINSQTTVDKKRIWDCICIGSDFDGQIDPINAFKKATDFTDWTKELRKSLNKNSSTGLKQGLSTKEIIEKITFKNVYEFLRRNY